jgi:hypothetical protein
MAVKLQSYLGRPPMHKCQIRKLKFTRWTHEFTLEGSSRNGLRGPDLDDDDDDDDEVYSCDYKD